MSSFSLKVPGKKYGLVQPKKKKPAIAAFANAGAGEESDEEMTVNQQIQAASMAKMRQKKLQAEYSAALQEDATVFEYDGVYDDMQQTRAASAASRKKTEAARKPKYIENIMKMAEYKKREEERVKERVEAKARLKVRS
eukprot:SAG31_NODE_5080_length_2754_cov_2.367232_4_plen_139_part_00